MVEVALRVAQTVGVVDPQAVDESFVEPAADLDVRVREDLGLLDAYAGKGAHGEEAPVVQVAVAAPPADQLVVLAPVHLVGSAVRRAGGDREPVVVVPQLVADHLEVTGRAVVDRQVVVAEHRHQQLALAELPVDVERLGMLGGRAVLEHVPPPRVEVRAGHPDVVRDDVDQHAHAEPAGLGGQRRESFGATPRRVHPVEPDHVVAVRAPGLGGEQRREVDPVDAQVLQVGQPGSRVEQVEVLADLQAIRGRRHPAPSGVTGWVTGWPLRRRPVKQRPSGRPPQPARGARGARLSTGAAP